MRIQILFFSGFMNNFNENLISTSIFSKITTVKGKKLLKYIIYLNQLNNLFIVSIRNTNFYLTRMQYSLSHKYSVDSVKKKLIFSIDLVEA